MAVPATRGQFGDLLDPRFQRIFYNPLRAVPDMVPTLFDFPPDNGREDMRWSQIGEFGDIPQFTGSVTYDDVSEGYDVVQSHIEFASGFQVERALYQWEQYNIMDRLPSGLRRAYDRTRQRHAAQVFNNAFSAANDFYSHSEGVALCSDSHTTTADGVSTASGFDNLTTSALSHTAVVAATIQMRGFKGDRGEPHSAMPDELWFPPNLYDKALEILGSEKTPEDANNSINVNQTGRSGLRDGTGRKGWEFMTDTNDWFLIDSQMRADNLKWVDSVPVEFAFVEDFDTLVAKWRMYCAYSWAWINWRWIVGAQVS